MTQDTSKQAADAGRETKTAENGFENSARRRADRALRRGSPLLGHVAGQRRSVGPNRRGRQPLRSPVTHIGRRRRATQSRRADSGSPRGIVAERPRSFGGHRSRRSWPR